ncbi:MAG TPA: citrate/2-methylcitrate synthase [Chthoniobacterales bacterium]|nr:citrate/2-methylcitrate synthase [Chthoniobacterales bacterium]
MSTETTPAYSPGLAGVIAGETAICSVDPNAGLMYRGYDIHEMAQKASFEEVAYLLLNGELPDGKQLAEFTRQIAAEREVPAPVMKMLRLLPGDSHPMDVLRTAVSMLSMFDKELSDNSHAANIRKSIRLIARVSTLITDGWRILHGDEPLPKRPDLTHAGNFFYKLDGKVPQDWQIRMLDTIFILYADHEFNASTFAARVTASTLAGIYAAVTSACGTLKGPLHGGANEESMKMLEEIKTPDRAEAWLKKKLETKEKIMGFGHRVYKKGDSRVPAMREIGRDLGKRTGKEQLIPICEKLEEVMEREKHLYANVDLYAAPVFWMLGFPPALNTPLFAASRVAGWCAHVVEQHDNNRLIRPRSLYTGPPARPYHGVSSNGAASQKR